MRLAYFAMPLHPHGADPAQTLEDDLAQLAFLDRPFTRRRGSVSTSPPSGRTSRARTSSSRALGVTTTMTLATGVSCLPNHDPLMLAQRIAQLDQMARGRFYWGVAPAGPATSSWSRWTARAASSAGPRARCSTRSSSSGQIPSPALYASKDKHWRFRIPEPQDHIGLRLHMKPYQRPHPPIGVAGVSSGSETLVLAGERGYIPMSINFVPPRILKTHGEAVASGARRAAGRRTAPPGASRVTSTSPTPTLRPVGTRWPGRWRATIATIS
jgi:alkanesulfonate monooxygenase SsuD/methylene tetrahydromethanopterin reductase-like flavin-dependent oxidoreductase (luciferase family)